MALTDKLTAIANGFRTSRGTQDKYTLDQMAVLAAEPTGGGELTEEDLNFTGVCQYLFAYGNWDWIINKYGTQITTTNVTSLEGMFKNCNVTRIPFEINCTTSSSGISVKEVFSGCNKLTQIPKFNNCTPSSMESIFDSCNNVRYIPEDIESWFNWSVIDGATSAYSSNRMNTFYGCHSLRSLPMSFLNHGNPYSYYSYSIYYKLFYNCYALDEVIGLPVPHLKATWTSNAFDHTFYDAARLKNITFALDPETNAPYVVKWKKQKISLTNTGYLVGTASYLTNVNSGITVDKLVKDDATYQALKNDPDWFARKIEYSRYNWDSAVATINSLPDASAYITAESDMNTIVFKETAGSATDGGSFSTHTDEEIAALSNLAESKGWTITFG